MKAGKTNPTVKKICDNCKKEFALDPNVPLKDQSVCKDCK